MNITPFIKDMCSDETININGKDMPIAYWNLVITKRDLSMWCKFGMKPHRHWKVSDAKKYFGIKGSKETLYNDFIEKYGHLIPSTEGK
jgi:hypothetical protein|tara:strand:- start:164 stop:427 length:264 start_codon:yes stop_codon:yes gene_type:complete